MLTVIAVALDLKGNPKTIRLAEVEDKRYTCGKVVEKHKMRTRDFDVSIVISELAKGTKVGGLKLVGGKLTGSNGALTRYMNINRTGVKSPLVVLARNVVDGNTIGFLVADGHGNVVNLKEDDTVEYAEKHGIANGKVVENAGKKFISSIEGEYAEINAVVIEQSQPKAVVTPQVINKQNSSDANTTGTTKISEVNTIDIKNAKIENNSHTEPLVPIVKQDKKKDSTPAPSYDDLKAKELANKGQPKYINPGGLKWSEGNNLRDEKSGLTVKEKVALCMMNIKKQNLFIHSILASMDRVPCNNGEINTMAVSPFTMTLYYNCNFVNKISVGQCLFVMIHESYHILMKHGLRQHKRDHRLWNMAGDYYINKLIAEQFNIDAIWPGQGEITTACSFVNDPNFQPSGNNLSRYIEGLSSILFNPKTDTSTESAETIYATLNMLKNKVEQEKKKKKQGGNESDQQQSSDGQSDDNGNDFGDGNESQKQNGTEGSGSTGNKNSSSSEGTSEDDSYNNSNGSNSNSSNGATSSSGSTSTENGESDDVQMSDGGGLKDNGDGTYSYSGLSASKDGYTYKDEPTDSDIINDAHDKGIISEEDYKKAQENVKRAVSNATAKVRQAGRELDLTSKRFVDSILEPKVDFRAILKKKLNMQTEYNSTWKRPSKRGELTTGINAPGRIKSIEDGLTRAVIAIDSSGSMTDEDLMYAFGYVKALCKQLRVDLDVCFWNTTVDSVYSVTDIKDISKIKEYGTGGTDVSCLFSYIAGETECIKSHKKNKERKRKTKTDVLIVITDGEFNENYSRYKHAAKDTIWILSDKVAYNKFRPLFGFKAPIQVDR